jgi:hypothetical protein
MLDDAVSGAFEQLLRTTSPKSSAVSRRRTSRCNLR